MQGKLQPFLAVAAQTLESFVRSLDDEVKTQTEDHNSQEHQFVLGLAGTITSELNAFVDRFCATYISQHILKSVKFNYDEHCYNNCLLMKSMSPVQAGAVVWDKCIINYCVYLFTFINV